MKQLFRNYEIRHVFVQLVFSSTFALSLTMFELIIFEIIGFLDSSSRYFHWRLGLTLLLFMVIALIPYVIVYSSISNIRIGGCSFTVYGIGIRILTCFRINFSASKMGPTVKYGALVLLSVCFLEDR